VEYVSRVRACFIAIYQLGYLGIHRIGTLQPYRTRAHARLCWTRIHAVGSPTPSMPS